MQEFIQQAISKYQDRFDYSRAQWSGLRGKLTIVCKQHDAEFEQTMSAFLKHPGCKLCTDAQKTDEFITKARKIHGERYDYTQSRCEKLADNIVIICNEPNHGQFVQSGYNHVRGMGCPKCGRIQLSQTQSGDTASFIQKSIDIHGNAYSYNTVVYVNSKTKVEITCNTCQKSILVAPYNHLMGKGCRTCGTKRAADKRRSGLEKVIEECRKVHGDKYEYLMNEYQNPNIPVPIRCIKHNFEFMQSIGSHKSGSGCPKCGRESATQSQTFTTEMFIQRSRGKHGANRYDYSQSVYKKATKPITIICPAHGPFSQSAMTHMNGGGCMKCAVDVRAENWRSTTVDFIAKSQQIHGNRYNYDLVDYKDAKLPVIITCSDGHTFSQTPNNHLRNHGCPECRNKLLSDQRKHTLESFVERARAKHGDKYSYDNTVYVNQLAPITIMCPNHGDFIQCSAVAHLLGSGCTKCSGSYQYDTTEFIRRAKSVHGDLYDYSKSEYTKSADKLIIVCKMHSEFLMSANKHLSGQKCPQCRFKTEGKLLEWLQVEFDPENVQQQITFSKCKKESTGKCYKYDFQVGNTIIELDGEQHFIQVSNWDSPEEALANDTIKAWSITSPDNGLHMNLIRIYQPWVAADSNNWQEQLLNAIISLEQLRGQVIYIGGNVYDRHRESYNTMIKYIDESDDGQSVEK